jgi:hypothetical protein
MFLQVKAAEENRTQAGTAPGPRGSPKLHEARETAIASIKAAADKHAANILPIIKEAQRAGATTLRQIAEVLNARGVATARGGQWHAMSVKNMLDRGIQSTRTQM